MKIKGYDKLIKDIRKFGEKGTQAVSDITYKSAKNIELKAKEYAPTNYGKLRQGIKALPLGDLTYIIVATEPYSAYVEFGTGSKVRVDPEMAAIASQFQDKQPGTFDKGLQAIKDWCKAKGIPQEAAYPIFISILREGIQARPFLYPAFVEGRDFYINELKTQLDKLTNDI